MNPRMAILVGAYLVVGLVGAWMLWGTTDIGADLATYQRAGEALWTTGDPYADNAEMPADYRYLYPPLLAMVIPVLVTGIHLPACFGACGRVDPGHKARDDQFRWIGLDQWHAARS